MPSPPLFEDPDEVEFELPDDRLAVAVDVAERLVSGWVAIASTLRRRERERAEAPGVSYLRYVDSSDSAQRAPGDVRFDPTGRYTCRLS